AMPGGGFWDSWVYANKAPFPIGFTSSITGPAILGAAPFGLGPDLGLDEPDAGDTEPAMEVVFYNDGGQGSYSSTTNAPNTGAGTGSPFGLSPISSAYKLSARIVASSLLISWPAELGGLQLEESGTLRDRDGWSAVTNAPVVGATEQTVTLPSTAAARFYRLKLRVPEAAQILVQAVADGHGSVQPTGSLVVDVAHEQTFIAKPEDGYATDHWQVNGSLVQADGNRFT